MPKLSIYFDYELQQGADMMKPKGDWGRKEYRNTNQLLELLDKYDVKVCFATLGKIAEGENLPYSSISQVQRIEKKGHEIGCHSYYHHLTSDISFETLYENIRDARERLDSVISTEVITFVPPGNIPFNFLGIPVVKKKSALRNIPFLKHFRLRAKLPSFRKKVHETVRRAGYKIYREYDFMINQESYTDQNGLRIQKLNFTGFGNDVQDYLKNQSKENELITCYGHPKSLSEEGEESFEALENLLKVIKNQNIDTILPREVT